MLTLKLAYLVLDAASWYMTGLIWFVQVVHYPLFAKVSEQKATEYYISHCNLTGLVVVVPMMIQATLALGIAFLADAQNSVLMWVNLSLVVIIWIVTALYSVPCHNSLCTTGYNLKAHQTLLRANWVRTILWTVCSLIMTTVLLKRI